MSNIHSDSSELFEDLLVCLKNLNIKNKKQLRIFLGKLNDAFDSLNKKIDEFNADQLAVNLLKELKKHENLCTQAQLDKLMAVYDDLSTDDKLGSIASNLNELWSGLNTILHQTTARHQTTVVNDSTKLLTQVLSQYAEFLRPYRVKPSQETELESADHLTMQIPENTPSEMVKMANEYNLLNNVFGRVLFNQKTNSSQKYEELNLVVKNFNAPQEEATTLFQKFIQRIKELFIKPAQPSLKVSTNTPEDVPDLLLTLAKTARPTPN